MKTPRQYRGLIALMILGGALAGTAAADSQTLPSPSALKTFEELEATIEKVLEALLSKDTPNIEDTISLVRLFLANGKIVQAEIDRLYAKAKAERKTLDFYSDANVMEYFAVGIEAYVSEDKLADQKIAYGHTRKELLERDPDLYKLIEKLDSMDKPADR